jgi:hypothetical protein
VAATLTAAGVDPDLALRKITESRGFTVPETSEQRRWFDEYARSHPAPLAS